MKYFFRDINWYRIGWILILGFLTMTASDVLKFLLIPEVSKSNPYWYTFMSYFNFISLWIVVLLVVYYFPNNRYIKEAILKNTKGNTYGLLSWGLFLGFLLNSFCALIAFWNGDIHLDFKGFELLPVIGLFVAVFIQSSAEEVLCRGFLYQKLLKADARPIFAIVINSLFFSLLHFFNDGVSLLAFYDLLITGVFFSLVVYYFDSLWMAMGLHATWNFTQSILLGLPNSGESFPYSVFHLDLNRVHDSFAYNSAFGLEGTFLSSFIMTVACIVLYIYKRKDKNLFWK
ncbi:CPBP family intramembrane glutamic endopeptidase [Streptococcus dysgalactiae]|uniref:CPBP family intramembrane glutamic endopeptidase n=1 Tax=Streptococcus dysgalactiae TaxID=1334 RepID=UPI0001F8646D|nr:type II CAAX endopeptidase family protein [Streptococcus dysgalactiae]EFY02009.1 CAAX amino terminal protease family protein [Streptococcus dysgalactiae subsp. dysgalactiae ATCC 27957]